MSGKALYITVHVVSFLCICSCCCHDYIRNGHVNGAGDLGLHVTIEASFDIYYSVEIPVGSFALTHCSDFLWNTFVSVCLCASGAYYKLQQANTGLIWKYCHIYYPEKVDVMDLWHKNRCLVDGVRSCIGDLMLKQLGTDKPADPSMNLYCPWYPTLFDVESFGLDSITVKIAENYHSYLWEINAPMAT